MAKQFQQPKVPKDWTLMQRINHYTCKTDNDEECWVWATSRDTSGYALLWWEGQQRRAARLLCAERGDALAADLVVMHICDNPPCMNPKHLKIGTVQDNVLDAFSKGRRKGTKGQDSHRWGMGHMVAGEKQGRAKLTWPLVREIRSIGHLYTQDDLAAKYGVSQPTIGDVLRKETWNPKYDPQTGSNIKENP